MTLQSSSSYDAYGISVKNHLRMFLAKKNLLELEKVALFTTVRSFCVAPTFGYFLLLLLFLIMPHDGSKMHQDFQGAFSRDMKAG